MRANRVRIIGGAWRSRLISFPPRRGLRPTPDRVRETLFNWLGQDLTGKTCLDLFAGSGALGFEAASRGARRVVMVERDATIYRSLQANREALAAAAVELSRADALEFLRADADLYDVVFLDPPFRADYWSRLSPLLPRHMAPGALLYYESAARTELPVGWETWGQGRAGQVRYQLLKRA
ncbi:MAG: 16S rRNA (guanine(966)-N(2))-methyltransferase RsmD [Betaproteobacteria bacterium]|nr:16S rRNA (guanine(966)-N(2))-methyltransferase RsmD [Betaproteobacteria bacterium]